MIKARFSPSLALLLLLAACGTSVSASEHCQPAADSCGGSLAGTWLFSSGSCYASLTADPSQIVVAIAGSLQLDFSPSGTFAASATGSTFTVTVQPAAFGTTLMNTSSCAQLDGEAEAIDGSCSGAANQPCVCTYPVSILNIAGAYTVSGDQVTLPSNVLLGANVTEPFCAATSTLTLGYSFGNFTFPIQLALQ